MRKIDSEELDSFEEYTAEFEGVGFTGYAVEMEPGIAAYRSFVKGRALGSDYSINEDGVLLDYSNISVNNPIVGASWVWDDNGSLRSERILHGDGDVRILRKWNSSGALEKEESSHHSKKSYVIPGEGFSPWVMIPDIISREEVLPGQFTATIRYEDLDQESGRDEFFLNGSFFTGNVFHRILGGGCEVRSVVDGLEEGPVFKWSRSGKVVVQGVRRHPYGPVGPWHEWDELGRLLRETIYDALGNKIIHRELDERQNIVKQERFEPTTLITDPESGEERPAPWL